jgi:hypothetical protein
VKFRGDKVIPQSEGRLRGVLCVVTEVYMTGKQSFVRPLSPRSRLNVKGRAVNDNGKWFSWTDLEDVKEESITS